MPLLFAGLPVRTAGAFWSAPVWSRNMERRRSSRLLAKQNPGEDPFPSVKREKALVKQELDEGQMLSAQTRSSIKSELQATTELSPQEGAVQAASAPSDAVASTSTKIGGEPELKRKQEPVLADDHPKAEPVLDDILPAELKKPQYATVKKLIDLEELWGGRSWAPTPEIFEKIRGGLVATHGTRTRGPRNGSVMDALVQTILSQNTTDVNSLRCFELLKVLETSDEEVAKTIKMGGLSKVKTARIKEILRQVKAARGEISLEYLRSESTEQVKQELGQYNGVGPKTIACVLMFNLEREDFPVDTHVTRISQRLGWTPENASREDTYEFLNGRMPDPMKYEMHLLIVQHGKTICQAAKLNCRSCLVREHCKTGVGRKSRKKQYPSSD